MAVGLDIADDGRFAGVIESGGPDGKPAITTTIVSADRKSQTRFGGGTGTIKLVPGEGVVAAVAGGKVIGKLGAADPKELVTLDGEVVSLLCARPAHVCRAHECRRARQRHARRQHRGAHAHRHEEELVHRVRRETS